MEKPAAEKTVAKRWDADGALQEEIPRIHKHTGANTDGRGGKKVVC
jgi:hypothetical protein